MEFFKLELENDAIIGTIEVPLNIDCVFIRDLYKKENKPSYFYDFLINETFDTESLKPQTELSSEYNQDDLKKEISFKYLKGLFELNFEGKELESHLANLTNENYLVYALNLGLELYTKQQGVLREYEKPKKKCNEVEFLKSKSFDEVLELIHKYFDKKEVIYFKENATQENYIELVLKMKLNLCFFEL